MIHAIAVDPLAWLTRRRNGGEDPMPDPVAQLRAELQAALQAERAERQSLASDLAAVRTTSAALEGQLAATRDELARTREYGRQQSRTIDLLDSTIKSLQAGAERNTAEIVALLGSNGALQEAQRRLESDHKLDVETINVLRERLALTEAKVADLTDTNEQYVGTIAGLRMAVAELNKRLDTAIERLRQAGMSVEGLI